MKLKLQIPVLPRVLKYVDRKYDSNFSLSKTHNAGKMLFHMLRNQQDKKRYTKQLPKYTSNLTVFISEEYYKERACCTLSAQAIYDFNKFIDNIIKDEFIHYVETIKGITDSLTVDQMVDGFMGKYNFDDGDITPYALKQCYYRFKRDEIKKTAKN